MDNKNRVILVVEDDSNDLYFLKRALGEAKIDNPLQIAVDGEEAVSYLAGKGKFSDREEYPLPILVLLDLKLPKRPGIEVLKWIQESGICAGPVIVFTSSSSPADIEEAYKAGAASYVIKPLELDKRRRFAELIKNYWLDLNETPKATLPK